MINAHRDMSAENTQGVLGEENNRDTHDLEKKIEKKGDENSWANIIKMGDEGPMGEKIQVSEAQECEFQIESSPKARSKMEKISKNTEDFKDLIENRGGAPDEARVEGFGRKEEVIKKSRDQYKREEEKEKWERRITRSQTRNSRSKESNENSCSSEEKSSSYILGATDGEQKILEVGGKCGFHRRIGGGGGQLKGNKKGGLKGNQ
ncbi:hypothetical protein L1887_38839 [Cichorium endivia]|nr:hypothetical protein L1887_38839 [Cichorium endivia]